MKTLYCPRCNSSLQFAEDASEADFLWDPNSPAASCQKCDELVYEDDALEKPESVQSSGSAWEELPSISDEEWESTYALNDRLWQIVERELNWFGIPVNDEMRCNDPLTYLEDILRTLHGSYVDPQVAFDHTRQKLIERQRNESEASS